MAINNIKARQILDSRGNPTIEVDVTTKLGLFRAAVPSGTSIGNYEALELRDKCKDYLGKGVLKAVNHINDLIGPALIKKGFPVTEQKVIDYFMTQELDGTPNKAKMGVNAILGVSLACCKAAAAEKDRPLYRYIADLAGNDEVIMPVPAFNVLNGGRNAGNRIAMEEFMILPVGAKSFSQALRIGAEVYQSLKVVIKMKYGIDACNVGDEGGFAPNIQDNYEGLDLIQTAISNAGYCGRVVIGMDVAASKFYHGQSGKYDLDFKNPRSNPMRWKSSDQMIELYNNMCRKYPIVSIEDPFEQDDWDAWIKFNSDARIQIMGGGLLKTNPQRIDRAVKCGACNALLLKVNQIGTVSESIDACRMAQRAGWGVMVSHRSGETEDTTIADMVVGLKCGQIKTGAPCRSERLAKYNQLLRIEEELGSYSKYAGNNFHRPL